jgi:hypothetical protein
MGRTVAGTTLGPSVGELLRRRVKAGRYRDNAVQRHDDCRVAGSEMYLDGWLGPPVEGCEVAEVGLSVCTGVQETSNNSKWVVTAGSQTATVPRRNTAVHFSAATAIACNTKT